ncbi:1-deoxy-D-xylulose-5-phosphate synthase [Verrucomicrobiota bacterium]
MSRILDKVNSPADLKTLENEDLDQLAGEVRSLIIDTVSKNGGHLAANLGVVELTIGLLKIFNPPDDKIIWDVSHQAYAYKILTDRKDQFNTLRQRNGISGFLHRKESKYDAFGAGHSGTALSAALGMAVARDQRKGKEHIVTVLGDGSAGCGISFEALNNVAGATKRFIVLLNDNEMSISGNVGAFSRYLGRLLASPSYNRRKRLIEIAARKMKMGWLRSAYYRIEEAIKSLFLPNVLFEEFGLRYVGPIDGHNTHALLDALTIARNSDRPILVHVSTKKGKGYKLAEQHPEKWHGTPPFEIATGEPLSKGKSPSYSSIFGTVLERLAEDNNKIVAITAAMSSGTGLSRFAEEFPGRFFDVGISEEHAVVFAAGLASEGLLPVFAVYSTFSQRAVDCIIHDVCLQNLPVVICLDRAGVVGDDGPTHHGIFDISLLRPIPGLVIMQPRDEAELANMLFTATRLGKPVVIRYPRGNGSGTSIPDEFKELEIGKAEVVKEVNLKHPSEKKSSESAIPRSGTSPQLATPRRGPQSAIVWIWALGDMVPVAEKTAELLEKKNVRTGVVNARFVSPLDETLLSKHVGESDVIVTMENGVVSGGFGTGVEEFLNKKNFKGRVLKFGWPNEFVPHGNSADLMEEYGLTADKIAADIFEEKNYPCQKTV